jgi:repressor LexA
MLTEAQEKVLAFIEQFRSVNQYPPTRREIARNFGWSSDNAAEEHLQALEKKGRIRINRGVARGLVVV